MSARRSAMVAVRWTAIAGVAVSACVGSPPPPPAASSSSTGPATASTGSAQQSDGSTAMAADTTGDGSSTSGVAPTAGSSTSDGGCIDHAECPDAVCVNGTCTTVSSCKQLEDVDAGDALPSGVYPLDPDGEGGVPSYEAYCELELMGGGWTLVLKALGESPTFEWDSPLWLDEDPYQPDFPDLDRTEAMLASYVHVSLTELLVGMEYPIGASEDLKMTWLAVPVEGDSLHALISPGEYVPTAAGREAWKGLIEGSSLQLNCNLEGLNAAGTLASHTAVRIGIIANEQITCETPDSRLGVGGRLSDPGPLCNTEPIPHGNIAGCNPDNGIVNLPAFAAVLVR